MSDIDYTSKSDALSTTKSEKVSFIGSPREFDNICSSITNSLESGFLILELFI